MEKRGGARGKQTHGPDSLGRILVGKKEETDWSVLVQEPLLLRRGYSDTEAILGCDWRKLVGSDKVGVARGNEEGSRGGWVR